MSFQSKNPNKQCLSNHHLEQLRSYSVKQAQGTQRSIRTQERRLIITCFTVGGVMLISLLRQYL